MTELGHIVYYVRNLDVSIRFYRDAVGLSLSGKLFNNRAAVLTGGRTHHELLLIQVADADGPQTGRRIGLYHAGWKVGDDMEALKRVKARIEKHGYVIDNMADHTISQSLYLRDPDGNEVELYVDNPECNWKEDNSWMQAPVKPLQF